MKQSSYIWCLNIVSVLKSPILVIDLVFEGIYHYHYINIRSGDKSVQLFSTNDWFQCLKAYNDRNPKRTESIRVLNVFEHWLSGVVSTTWQTAFFIDFHWFFGRIVPRNITDCWLCSTTWTYNQWMNKIEQWASINNSWT